MYYVSNGFMAITVLVIFVKIQVSPEKSEPNKDFLDVMKKIKSPILAFLILFQFIFGILYSNVMYYNIYAQTELGASSMLVGKHATFKGAT